jgi:NAD(P)-dependent dehydrogenase (short-subunit alcohol dehydrogenase family)
MVTDSRQIPERSEPLPPAGNAHPWSASDVPDQGGRTAVITGANTGIGFESAAVLAERGARVVLAVRDVAKGHEALKHITAAFPQADVSVKHLDLTSLQSVRQAAEELRSSYDRIDLLINNAGVMWTPRGRTRDGFELHLGTNHLGHFALTGLLMDRLLAASGSRIVTVSSTGHRVMADIHFDDLQYERRYSRFGAYNQSKLANLLFTYELERRLAAAHTGSIAVAAHPGGAKTALARYLPLPFRLPYERVLVPLLAQSAAEGALPVLRAATDPYVRGGQYYGPDGLGEFRGNPIVVQSSRKSRDTALQRRLWDVSEELTGVTSPV